ncbi:hypothetical protein SAMN05519105_3917 [Rhodobacter sp. 24-YEA-8]|nr:hypothetical protein SAMN05519105_3917 [Rhodobacter sp. 24-YEA-8]
MRSKKESEQIRQMGSIMQSHRLTGPGAGSEKYDLLTAMAVNGLSAGGTRQATMMRLIALVTARYNWAADEVTIGQREMAALWSVDQRTAKRETRRLIDAGLLEISRPGVRGRVASYRLCRAEIYRQTAPGWASVGPDYDARMSARHIVPEEAPAAAEVSSPKVVQVNFGTRPVALPASAPWDKVLARLAADQPGTYAAWFSQLKGGEPGHDGTLRVVAPSRFLAVYIASRLMVPLERAVAYGYGCNLRCSVVTEDQA